jgi:DNA-binding response OmpR family regulator
MSTILIIDDDPDFLQSEGIVLEKAGFSVTTASTPEDGLGKVKSASPDLVILDVMMPDGYEGFDVARNIRVTLGLRNLPIVLLTSLHEAKKVPYRFAPDKNYLPVDVFLDKPAKPDELVATVRKLLGEQVEEPKTPL